jgi:transposase
VLLTADEAGFNLLSSAMRTYAFHGCTPILQQDCKYTHLSVIAAISPGGSIISDLRDSSFDGASIVAFLRRLLATFQKEIHLIWDGANIHSCQAVRDFLSTEPQAKRLFLYRIPAYSPELNPTEQLWNNMKNVQLKNVFSKNRKQLEENVIKTLNSITDKKELIAAFFRHPKVVF